MITTKEMIEVMKAYEDGKQIQFKLNNMGEWYYTDNPIWNWSDFDYRIKPEEPKPTYRPYESVDEMVEDYCKRFGWVHLPENMPSIWVKAKGFTATNLITGYSNTIYEVLIASNWITLKYLFKAYTYLDGSPCGKLVEE